MTKKNTYKGIIYILRGEYMEVYIDIYLLENIIINLFLLLLTFKLLRMDYKKRNVYLAALLGGVYGLVIFCNVKILSSVVLKILVPTIMIYISMEKEILNLFSNQL